MTIMAASDPTHLVQTHLKTMFGYLPGVFDADIESVHQARIATRRLREVLPLMGSDHPGAARADEMARDAGRALGRVRELDVMSAMLEQTFDRVPAAAVAVARARRAVQRQQIEARRLMVTTLEALDLPHLERLLRPAGRLAAWRQGGAAWRAALGQRIAARADEMAESVRHAGGVYFPNRTHRARVSVK